ncbi:hypothetical protein [Phytohabitans suffuscus]|uniref:Methyltransferase n=1 Tax=Phytohabitans suffuscus TaxID=624315 RepID=A0A6F8YCA4_9ACTN|nr:hypothetical protein [Phytohabitans suffuscus]BCB83663.1 hypothetical protein Psuf_009760 [Phytohabitans suffuscus]
MPHSTQHDPTTAGLPPVPVALLLPTPDRRRRPASVRPTGGDWFDLGRRAAAAVIANYTRRGDLVIDLDRSPTIAAAARWLHRHPATLVTDSHRQPRARRTGKPVWGRRGAGLIIARLPRPEAFTLDLHGMTRAMHTWRRLLRPGGFLLTVLTVADAGNHATAVITAARTAGLTYHQHLIAARAVLPEHEPRAEATTAFGTIARLLDGRHVVTHTGLYAFATTTSPASAQGDTDA